MTMHYEKDADGIVTVTMDMSGPVNAMNEEFRTDFGEIVERLEAEEGLTGVVIASAKKVFFAGGDLKPRETAGPRRGRDQRRRPRRRIRDLPRVQSSNRVE